MQTDAIPIVVVKPAEQLPLCRDLDEDCEGVESKPRCWLHMPEMGRCPYLTGERDVHPF